MVERPERTFLNTVSRPSIPTSIGRLTNLVLCTILLVAIAARALRSTADLPYITHWDEPQIANASLEMMKTGDLNPHFFNYGSLLIYLNLAVDVVHYFNLVGRPQVWSGSLASLDELEVGLDPDFPWYVSHPSFYAWNRLLTALFGTGSVLLAFLLGREIGDHRTGLIAAFFLGTLEFHVENSAYVKTDVPASFFAVLGVWLSLSYLRNQKPALLVAAAGAMGLASSIKYNLATGLLIPIAALAIAQARKSPGYRPWLWGSMLVLPPLMFLLGTPFALFDLRTFLDHAGFEIHHYLVAGHQGYDVEPGLPHVRLDIKEMIDRAGLLPLLAAGIGLVVSGRKRTGFLLFALPLLQIWLTSRTRVAFHRNLLVVYPFLAVALGAGLSWILERGGQLMDAARPRWRQASMGLAWSLLALMAGYKTALTLSESWKLGRTAETRSAAVSRVNDLFERFPGRWDKVLIASELRLHPSDRKRIRVPFEVRPTIELLCPSPRQALLMLGSDYRGRGPEERARANRINELLAGAPEPVSPPIRGSPLWLDLYSRRPGVELRESAGCSASGPAEAAR